MKDAGIAFYQRIFKMKITQNTYLHPDLRINSYGHYLRQRFGCRISKVNLDAGFTCPNRDGSKGVGGCIFCNNASFSPRETIASVPLKEQLEAGMAYHRKRLGSQKFIAYFQKYTNTYAAVEQLEELYMDALSHPDVIGISVGTRPDCLTDQTVELLARIAEKHYLCLELGLQSANDSILQEINRGHTLADFVNSVQRASGHGFDICGHLIYGFSDENPQDFLPTADLFNSLPGISSIKLHQLHVVEGTPLASLYRKGQFTPLQLEQYVNTAADFLERLHPRISIQRLYGSSPQEILVAPRWGLKNNQLWYAVINELKRRNSWQGAKLTDL